MFKGSNLALKQYGTNYPVQTNLIKFTSERGEVKPSKVKGAVMKVSGFFKCQCNKSHCFGGIFPSSECVCGANLYDQMWRIASRRAAAAVASGAVRDDW